MKARKLSLEEFVDEIYEDSISNTDAEYVFFLGAGCSKSSGIPLASELAKTWYAELSKQSTKYKKFNDEHNINDTTFGKFYFHIFESLFPTPLMQQKEIQRITNNEDVQPSFGYYTLASLMQKSQFNTIITTNFDNLLQDALIYRNEKRALVITHEDLAQFIKRDDTPMITKIHGDAHIHPFNNKKDTKEIPKELKTAIQSLFINTKVVFIGYGGDDKSIENLLSDCERIDQVYWCSTKEPQNVELSNWWKSSNTKVHVEERDFDRIMTAIQSKFRLKSPDFSEIANNLQVNYTKSVKKENKEIEEIKDEKKTSSDYFSLAYSYAEIDEHKKAIDLYQKAIEINPENDEAYNNRGVSYDQLGEYKKAINSYEEAIKINPKASNTYNMGVSYQKLGEYKEAINSYEEAIKINSEFDIAYANMGIIYAKLGKYEKAIMSYKKAIEINPKNDIAYTNLFETQIINNIPLSKDLEEKYKVFFKNDKSQFLQYEMLKIIENINNEIDTDIKIWEEQYKDENLKDWSFDILENWVITKEGKVKEKLLEAITIFKSKVEK